MEQLDTERGQHLLYELGSEIFVAAVGHTPASWIAQALRDVRRLRKSARTSGVMTSGCPLG